MAGEDTGVIQATAADRIRAFGVSSGKTKLMTDSMVGNSGRNKRFQTFSFSDRRARGLRMPAFVRDAPDVFPSDA